MVGKINKKDITDLYKRIVDGKETSYKKMYAKLNKVLKNYKYTGKKTYEDINHWYVANYEAQAPVRKAFDRLDKQQDITISSINEQKLLNFIDILNNLKYFGSKNVPLYLEVSNKPNQGKRKLTIHQVTQSNVKDIVNDLMLLGGLGEDINGWRDTDSDIMQAILDKDAEIHMYYGRPSNDDNDIGGYFPYINTDPNIDLSFAGIYHEINEDNYKTNCLIQAIEQSGALTPQQIEDLKITNLTRYIHTKDLSYLAEKYKIYIVVSRFYDGKLHDPTKYGDKNNKLVKLLLRENHYMHMGKVNVSRYYIQNHQALKNFDQPQFIINADHERDIYRKTPLNYVLSLMFDSGMFEPIETTEICEKYTPLVPTFEDVSYDSENGCREYVRKSRSKDVWSEFAYMSENALITNEAYNPVECLPTSAVNAYVDSIDKLITALENNNIKFQLEQYRYKPSKLIIGNSTIRSVDKFIPSELIPKDEQFIESMTNIFGHLQKISNLNPYNYGSLAGFVQDFAASYGCFDGVYQLSGKVRAFFNNCCHGGLVNNLYDDHLIESDIITLDINSAYGSAMKRSPGIPIGPPKPFTDIRVVGPDDYYVARVEIDHCLPIRFHPFSNGINYLDKYDYERLEPYMRNITKADGQPCIKVLNGYYFDQGYNTKIKDFVELIYSHRFSEDKNIARISKFMLTHLYGSMITRGGKTFTRTIPTNELDDFMNKNSRRFIRAEVNGNKAICTISKTFSAPFNLSSYGAMVLSLSKDILFDIINPLAGTRHFIWRVMTDSITISKRTYDENGLSKYVGDSLGMFKVEYEASKLYLINKNN